MSAGAVQTHSGHLGGVWGQAMRGSPDATAAGQYTSPAPAHGHLAAHHARFAFQGAPGVTSVAAASCREAPSAAYLSRANGLGTYAYMGTEVAPWVGVESGLTSIQTGSASPFARITGCSCGRFSRTLCRGDERPIVAQLSGGALSDGSGFNQQPCIQETTGET